MLVETTNAKLRLFRVPDLLSAAFILATLALAILLLFQSAVYANGPWAGAAAEGVHLTPIRRAYKSSAQSTGARPPIGANTMAMSIAAGLSVLAVLFVISLAAPPAPPEPGGPAPLLPQSVAS